MLRKKKKKIITGGSLVSKVNSVVRAEVSLTCATASVVHTTQAAAGLVSSFLGSPADSPWFALNESRVASPAACPYSIHWSYLRLLLLGAGGLPEQYKR